VGACAAEGPGKRKWLKETKRGVSGSSENWGNAGTTATKGRNCSWGRRIPAAERTSTKKEKKKKSEEMNLRNYRCDKTFRRQSQGDLGAGGADKERRKGAVVCVCITKVRGGKKSKGKCLK